MYHRDLEARANTLVMNNVGGEPGPSPGTGTGIQSMSDNLVYIFCQVE